MSRLIELKSASTLSELAPLLNFKPAALAYVLYRVLPSSKYTSFEISKRSGGTRSISAPIPQLKRIQRNLAELLQDCWEAIYLANRRKNDIAHGFMRGRSIVSNARRHRNRNYVFNVDLKEFFPSINFGRVRGYFIKDASFALNPAIATIVAQIACHDNSLPQGSPCSPVISNLIGHVLDIQLVAMAARAGCTYSRYADDLTFSTNKAEFPTAIAERNPTHPHEWTAGKSLAKIVTRSGFALNPGKTRMQYHDSRQEVTGLVVNRRVNVRREYRNTARALVHNLVRKGSLELRDHTGTLQPATLEQLHGMLGFIDTIDLHARYEAFVNGEKRNFLKKPAKELTVSEFGTMSSQHIGKLSAGERLFQRFLFYKDFYAATKPVVVCEGDTDNVYLLHAIHSLAPKFPTLATAPVKGTSQLKIRLFKYVGTRTGRLLDLGDGGGPVLGTLIDNYLRETRRFLAPISTHPFIVLVDNDSGGAALNGILKKHKAPFPPGTAYVHVARNLYVMRTPLLHGKPETAIEDFFDAATKAQTVNGKSFNVTKGANPALFFGKTVFAHKVVRPNAKTIDFSGFEPLLATIVAIQKHYATIAASVGITPAITP